MERNPEKSQDYAIQIAEFRGESMGRTAKKAHEVVPYRSSGNKAYARFAGRQYYLGPWDTEKGRPSAAASARLEELRAMWTANPDATPRSRPGDPLLAELWANWRQSEEGQGGRPESIKRAEKLLFGSKEAPAKFRHLRAGDFTAGDLRDVQRAMCAAKLSRYCVAETVRDIRRCFAWGLVEGLVKYEQVRMLELVEPPAAGKVKEAVTRRGVLWEHVEPALAKLSPPLAAVVRLLDCTGARPSELLSLKAGEVKQSGPVLAASGVVLDLTELGVWAAVKEEHKTDGRGYDRVIFFGPKAQAILTPIVANRGEGEHLFRPADGRAWDAARKRDKRKPGNYGTYKRRVGEKGKRQPGACYDSHALTVAVRRACDLAGGVKWTPYQIRHAAGVRVQGEYGREASRVFLGHKVGGVTERYAGADLKLAAKVAKESG